MTTDPLLSIKQSRPRFLRLIAGKTIGTLAYGLLLILLIQPLRTNNPSPITNLSVLICLIFLGILIWRLQQTVSGWFWEIKVMSNLLHCQTLNQNSIIINQKDVERLEGNNTGLILGTSSQRLHLNLRSLPLKEGVILVHAIGNWAPHSIFPPQTQIELLQRENNDEAIRSMRYASHTASKNKNSRWGIRGLGLSVGLGFSSILIWLGLQRPIEIQPGIETLIATWLIIGIPVAIIFSMWVISIDANILVDNTGITYIQGKQYSCFPWENITAIFIDISEPSPEIHIWEENKTEKKLSFSYFNKDDKLAIGDVINKQSFARNIPFNWG